MSMLSKAQYLFKELIDEWYLNRGFDLTLQSKQIDFYTYQADKRFYQIFGVKMSDCSPIPKKVLDVGCGFGHISLQMAITWPNAEISAQDISDEFFRVSQKVAQEMQIDNIKFKINSAQNLSKVDAADLVVSSNMLNYFPRRQELQNALHGMALSTKPNGRLGLYFPHFFTIREPFSNIPFLHFFPPLVRDLMVKRTGRRDNLRDVKSPSIVRVIWELKKNGLQLERKSLKWPKSIFSKYVSMSFVKKN